MNRERALKKVNSIKMNALDADLSLNDISKPGNISYVVSTPSKNTIELVRKMKAGESGPLSSRLVISGKNDKRFLNNNTGKN